MGSASLVNNLWRGVSCKDIDRRDHTMRLVHLLYCMFTDIEKNSGLGICVF